MISIIGSSPIVPAIAQPPQTILASSDASVAAAHKFESMAIAQFLKPIFATMGKADAPFGGGSAARQFQPFLIDAIAKSMESRGGLGLAPMIENALATQSAKAGTGPVSLPGRTTGGSK
ncbi:MAG: rod-binding protein [Acidiphilium sp.]|nr:rod-binding protein [Acidiphilium sp.]MDD4935473.1 rod-binding protein [Acidiphilium sp.]